MEPAELSKSGFLGMVGGSIVAPELPTCNGKTFDYVIVSNTMVAANSHAIITRGGKKFIVAMNLASRAGHFVDAGGFCPSVHLVDSPLPCIIARS